MIKIVQMTIPCQKHSFYKIIALPGRHSQLLYALVPAYQVISFQNLNATSHSAQKSRHQVLMMEFKTISIYYIHFAMNIS